MILRRLFLGLFGHGVILVATSHCPPQDLYKDGLQEELFEPCRQMLQDHVVTLQLPSRLGLC